MNKKISLLLAGVALASPAAFAQNGTQQPATQPPPVTSPQVTGASSENPTGTNGPREDALNTGTAGAQAGLSGNGTTSFESLDKSHRGYLRQIDVATNKQLSAQFKTCDTNRDGKLDRTEYDACVKADQSDKY